MKRTSGDSQPRDEANRKVKKNNIKKCQPWDEANEKVKKNNIKKLLALLMRTYEAILNISLTLKPNFGIKFGEKVILTQNSSNNPNLYKAYSPQLSDL